jgi:hypothetical protein
MNVASRGEEDEEKGAARGIEHARINPVDE